MQRRSLSLVLSLLLLFAQHGAVLHELSHLSHGTSSHGSVLRASQPLLDNETCATCHAFSQVANPGTAAPAVFADFLPALVSSVEPSYAIVGIDTPTPRSRGPPQV
jgi:hypothetical protein